MTDNQPATKKINTPVMIIQGKAPAVVPYTLTDALQQCLKGFGISETLVPVQRPVMPDHGTKQDPAV